MNVEIISAETKTNKKHTFTFSKPVQQFMVGFSKCLIQYPNPDHHVKEITIDLTNSQKNNNEIIVEPKLILTDTSNHSQSHNSAVKIVVLAIVGDGNPNIRLYNGIKTNVKYDMFSENSIVKSALNLSFVQFPESDHHVYKYSTNIKPVVESATFTLKGQSEIRDKHPNIGVGQVFGSAIIYSGVDSEIIFADFDSKKLGNSGSVSFGEIPDNFQTENYELACFINNYSLAFKKNDDHHLLKFEVSAEINDESLHLKDNSVYADLNLNAFLTDNGQNHFNIPHNSVSGFIIAIQKK